MILKFLDYLGNFLKKIDSYRDKLLFIFIKPYWPRKITPDQLSYSRIAIGIALIILLFLKIDDKALILSLFCVGAITDLLDGSVSRCLNKTTDYGAILDTIADRFLILPIAIYSLYGPHQGLLFWLLLMEVFAGLISFFHESKGIHIPANIFGKTRMVLLSVVFVVILIYWPASPPEFFIDVIWGSLIFSILSIFAKIMELNKLGKIKNKIVTKEYLRK